MDHTSNVQVRQDGFTLIEMLVVVTIIGLLAAVVTFAVSNLTDRGDTSACRESVHAITIAQEARKASATNAYAADVNTLLTENWIRRIPKASYGILTNSSGSVTSTAC